MANQKAEFYYGDPLKKVRLRLLDVGDAESFGPTYLDGSQYMTTHVPGGNGFVIRHKYAETFDVPPSAIFNLLEMVGTGVGSDFTLWATPQKIGGIKVNWSAPTWTITTLDSSNSNLTYMQTSDQSYPNFSSQNLELDPCICHVRGIATIGYLWRYDVVIRSSGQTYRFWSLVYGADALDSVADLLNLEPWDNKNPYDGGDYTDTGGGDPDKQNWDDYSDTLDDEDLPDETETGAVGTGFSTIFSPTKSQLQHLADVMWGNDLVSFLQNQVENIGSMFVSLGIVPFTVTKGATRRVMWLGLVDTAISLDTAAQQFYEIDMGTIDLATDLRIHRTDSVFDYSPFSRLGIYLPFIGFQELDIDECRGNPIGLKYKIDILSGSCVAWVYISGNPIYQFSGNCITQIPLSSQDAQSLFTNAVQVGIAAASAGVTSSVASAGDAMSAERYMSGQISATQAEYMAGQHAAQVSNAESGLASATANGMMGMKPNYKRSGAVSASTSLISLKQPYLFLTTPREAVPERYQKYCGFPSNITKQLGNLEGFTVVEDIRLNGLVATSTEVEEIYQLLKTGVII